MKTKSSARAFKFKPQPVLESCMEGIQRRMPRKFLLEGLGLRNASESGLLEELLRISFMVSSVRLLFG